MEEEADHLSLLITCAVMVVILDDSSRQDVVIRRRLDWDWHSQTLIVEGAFKNYYRMSSSCFEALLNVLAPDLLVNCTQSSRRSGIVACSPALKLQLVLSWYAGYGTNVIRALCGVSKSYFYDTLWQVSDAINSSDDECLRISFYETEAELKKSALEFSLLSTGGAFLGCVICIDGWLCLIRRPRASEVARVQSFFSGHYQTFGVNVQAGCDASCRFTSFSVKAPGGMGDAIAFLRWGLGSRLDKLPTGYFAHADNAYKTTRTVMTPYTKPQLKLDPRRDGYNFFFSQLRIRIEMAFGMLVNKWRIFQQPLNVAFVKVPVVIHTAFRLHNWVLNYEMDSEENNETVEDIPAVMYANLEARGAGYRNIDGNEEGDQYDDLDVDWQGENVREALVTRISNLGLARPSHNVERNN